MNWSWIPVCTTRLQKRTSGKGEQSHASLSARIHSPATGTDTLAIHFNTCKILSLTIISQSQSATAISSARLRAHLIRRALCPHLTLNSPRLPSRRTSRALCLLSLLLAFSGSFLLLALRDGFLAGCFPGFGSLRAAVFD